MRELLKNIGFNFEPLYFSLIQIFFTNNLKHNQ